MKIFYLKKLMKSHFTSCNLGLTAFIFLIIFGVIAQLSPVSAQAVLFDFDNAPAYSPLPINLSSGGITAHFSATGQGYSIQAANVMGFTPQGFAGNIIYPSSIYLSDLLIRFDQKLTDFSIMYACQELGCDDAATMRVTAYQNGSFVGTNTRTATFPGTWPVDTLRCSFPQGFDSVVVHYDSPPPTCHDYGVIFMADNMRVTKYVVSGISIHQQFMEGLKIVNPLTQYAKLSFSLHQPENLKISVYDITGRQIKDIFNGILGTGEHQISLDVSNDAVIKGVYFLKVSDGNVSRSWKLVF